MSIIKIIFGMALAIAGIALGLWVGVWWAFIGGIVDVIQAIRAPELVANDLAIGVAKVLFASPIGSIAGLALVLPARAIVQSA